MISRSPLDTLIISDGLVMQVAGTALQPYSDEIPKIHRVSERIGIAFAGCTTLHEAVKRKLENLPATSRADMSSVFKCVGVALREELETWSTEELSHPYSSSLYIIVKCDSSEIQIGVVSANIHKVGQIFCAEPSQYEHVPTGTVWWPCKLSQDIHLHISQEWPADIKLITHAPDDGGDWFNAKIRKLRERHPFRSPAFLAGIKSVLRNFSSRSHFLNYHVYYAFGSEGFVVREMSVGKEIL